MFEQQRPVLSCCDADADRYLQLVQIKQYLRANTGSTSQRFQQSYFVLRKALVPYLCQAQQKQSRRGTVKSTPLQFVFNSFFKIYGYVVCCTNSSAHIKRKCTNPCPRARSVPRAPTIAQASDICWSMSAATLFSSGKRCRKMIGHINRNIKLLSWASPAYILLH